MRFAIPSYFSVQNVVDYIQGQGRAIDVLLMIDQVQRDDEFIQWRHIKEAMEGRGGNIADGTWRKRAKELTELGLLETAMIDRLKFKYRLNKHGREIAALVAGLDRTLKTPA